MQKGSGLEPCVGGSSCPLPGETYLAIGSIWSVLWESVNGSPLFPRMNMWGANELDGFSAPTICFVLSESLSHVCSRPCAKQCDTGWVEVALRSSQFNERLRQHFKILRVRTRA